MAGSEATIGTPVADLAAILGLDTIAISTGSALLRALSTGYGRRLIGGSDQSGLRMNAMDFGRDAPLSGALAVHRRRETA